MAGYDLAVRLAELQKTWEPRQPNLPVPVAVCEGHKLFGVVNSRREAFVALPGLNPDYIDALPMLASKLDECESKWREAKRDSQSATLRPVREEAERFRSEITASARYLLRKNKDAQLQLDQIVEGSGVEDLVADLRELARLATTHATILAVDRNLPPEVPTYANGLADKLSTVRETPEAHAAQEIRNQVFALLDEAMSEVRAAGRFIYRHDPKTLALLGSEYASNKKRRHRENKAPATKSTVTG